MPFSSAPSPDSQTLGSPPPQHPPLAAKVSVRGLERVLQAQIPPLKEGKKDRGEAEAGNFGL